MIPSGRMHEEETMSNTVQRGLSTEQVAQFHAEGFLVVEDLIPESILAAMEQGITDQIDRLADALVRTGELSSSYSEEPFTRRLTRITAETTRVIKEITDGALAIPAIFDMIRCEELLDVAESLCGPELIASSVYRLRPKLPDYGPGVVPWHQDSGYFEPYCDRSLILTCWIPLVDADARNGCLQVLRFGHRGAVVPHGFGPHHYLEIAQSDLPAGEVVTVPVRRGGVLLLTNLTPHCSTPNVSDAIRWSMDLRYQAAGLPTNAPITRLPEELPLDASAPVACYPPEADVLIRSRKRPAQVLHSAAEIERIRTSHAPGAITERWGNRTFWKEGGRRRTGHEQTA
ncbi:MAG: Protein involved in biosynthesis of mitomycin antibiotics/polyketide fumonisin [Chthonomonadales bacterium]|nr:Protein involved in biosynthesis of mitomycin antibiotics/polyketide fumonisin [Chthonomonadales bacterium]